MHASIQELCRGLRLVEVAVEIARYAAVDDVARAINPLILHGQTHGGIAQGVLS